MRTFTWDHITKWDPDMIQAYFTEQIAHLMKHQADLINRVNRTFYNNLDEERALRHVTELALELMVSRETVLMCFNDQTRVQLHYLQQKLMVRGIRAYMTDLRQAIPKTDYLVLVPSGRGWCVWRAEDWSTRQQAAGSP